MGLIQCKAFTMHGCMKKATTLPLVCCHSCRNYVTCSFRCENKPMSCGMNVVTDEKLYKPFEGTITKKKKQRGVAKYDAETGELLAVYESVKDAAYSVQNGNLASNITLICRCASGGQKSSKGYAWRHID